MTVQEPTPKSDRELERLAVFAFALLLLWVYLANASVGLWEDGYFVVRFARNFWRHGVFAWNVEDGPLYGMTSQTLQLMGTLLYKLAPHHLVLTLKASLAGALLLGLVLLARLSRLHAGSSLGVLPGLVGLSMPLTLKLIESGLETAYALCVLIAALYAVLQFERGRARLLSVSGLCLLVYATRPDAILIPAATLMVFLAYEPRKYLPLGFVTALFLGAFLLACQAYYGTALPLPFYIKTHGLSAQTAAHVSIFASEKSKNVVQFLFVSAPFVFIACHQLTKQTVALLASAALFVAYHYFFTIETMGHLSRFYVPGLAPLLCASALAFATFRARSRWVVALGFFVLYGAAFALLLGIDRELRIPIVLRWFHYLPLLAASAVLLLFRLQARASVLVLSLVLLSSTALANPVSELSLRNDRTILLAQIKPRRVFRGLFELRERVKVRTLFHTDMGAPGLLFPKARVVDLDGLLNREITLGHVSFEQLCVTQRPEAVFVPNETYPELRAEVLNSPCMKDYRPVDKRRDSPLRIRKDLYQRYMKTR